MTVDRTDCVNYESSRKKPSACYHGLASWQSAWKTRATNITTLFKNPRAARTMNRAVNAAPAQQTGVRSIHDCIRLLSRDVARQNTNATVKKTFHKKIVMRTEH